MITIYGCSTSPTTGRSRVLRADVDVDEAANLLWLLTSFDSFDLLYTGRALSIDDVARALVTTAERTLCRWRRTSSNDFARDGHSGVEPYVEFGDLAFIVAPTLACCVGRPAGGPG